MKTHRKIYIFNNKSVINVNINVSIKGGEKNMPKKKKDIDEMIRETLEKAPVIQGYTIKELSEITETPWPTTRWHLELLEARGVVKHKPIGRAKLYSLKD